MVGGSANLIKRMLQSHLVRLSICFLGFELNHRPHHNPGNFPFKIYPFIVALTQSASHCFVGNTWVRSTVLQELVPKTTPYFVSFSRSASSDGF